VARRGDAAAAIAGEARIGVAVATYAKHGIGFEHARLVFDDAFAVEGVDDSEAYGEERFTIVGMVQSVLLFYAERGDGVRLISARRATKNEQEDYFEQST
jgi:uncharacterized DUF497 family protein